MAKSKRKYSSAKDRVRQAAAQQGPGGGGGTMFHNMPGETEFYNPEKGRVTLRILPYVVTDKKHPDGDLAPVDSLWYKRPFKRYRNIGVESKPYISPLSVGKADPIFEYFKEAKADPSIPEKETDRAKAQDCVMYCVQTVDKKGKVSDPMFFWYSFHLFEKQLKKELNDPENEEYQAFMDLEDGYDIKVRWEEDSFGGHAFLYADRIEFVSRDDIDEDILDDVVDLDDVLVIKSYDELQAIFLEIDEPGDDGVDNEGDGAEAAAKKKAAKKKADKEKAEKEEAAKKKAAEAADENEGDDECPRGLTFATDFDSSNKCKKCRVREACEKAADTGSSDDKNTDATGDGDCPHGHTFAVDCDEHPEDCDKCEVWDSCADAQDALKKK